MWNRNVESKCGIEKLYVKAFKLLKYVATAI